MQPRPLQPGFSAPTHHANLLRLCHCPSGQKSARGTTRSTMHTLPPFSSAPNPCATPGIAASCAAGFSGAASAICSGCPSSSRLSSVPSAGPSLSCAAAACARAICASKISRCLSSSSYVGHRKEATSQDVTHRIFYFRIFSPTHSDHHASSRSDPSSSRYCLPQSQHVRSGSRLGKQQSKRKQTGS
jgi:hypothetical protein